VARRMEQSPIDALRFLRRVQVVLLILAFPLLSAVLYDLWRILNGTITNPTLLLVGGLVLGLIGALSSSLQRGSSVGWRCCSVLGVTLLPAIPIGTLPGLILLRALDRQSVRDFCGVGGTQYFED
jgi:hypothetical protein